MMVRSAHPTYRNLGMIFYVLSGCLAVFKKIYLSLKNRFGKMWGGSYRL